LSYFEEHLRISVVTSLLELKVLLSQDELERIPTHYRLFVKILLKLPNPGLPFFILKRFPGFEGIFWALVVPIFLALYSFFTLWLFSFATIHFGFPSNYVLGVLIPAIILIFFLRIQLERTVLWWKNINEQPREWQISKKVEELAEILNRQRKRSS